MKISEILWKAANEHLWTGSGLRIGGITEFTCCAISFAESDGDPDVYDASRARAWINEMFDVPYFCAFDEFPEGRIRQSVRYAWLMFASMVASEMEERGEL